jgi:hypothetical protein
MRNIYLMGMMLVMSIMMVASASSDITFSEQINRPSNFMFTDNVQMSGHNSWSHMTQADAGSMDVSSMFKTLDCVNGAAPEEKSSETMMMTFFKNGEKIDPLIGETIDSDITVGAYNNVVPTFDTHGMLTSDPNDRYDVMKYTMTGLAGLDGSRDVSSQLMSSQDDWIHVKGFDSAGNLNPVVTSWTEVTIPGMPGTDESQAYRMFNWQDNRGWKPVVGDLEGQWDISNVIQYQMYPISFNFGK